MRLEIAERSSGGLRLLIDRFQRGERVLTASAKIGKWVSGSRGRLYSLFLALMVLPIAIFAYSVGQLLKHQVETQALTESTQIARISSTLVDENFRQSTAFLQSIVARRRFLQAWNDRDFKGVEWDLQQASSLRPDFAFVSAYDLDGTMRAVYPAQPTIVNQNFAYRDWYKGVPRLEAVHFRGISDRSCTPSVGHRHCSSNPRSSRQARWHTDGPLHARNDESPFGGNQDWGRVDDLVSGPARSLVSSSQY